jgi:hypothetical protein
MARPKQGCGLRTALGEQNGNFESMGRSPGSELLADFVQRFMRVTEPLTLRRVPLAALGKSGTSHSASRRELVSMSYRDQAIFTWRNGHGRTRQSPSRIL